MDACCGRGAAEASGPQVTSLHKSTSVLVVCVMPNRVSESVPCANRHFTHDQHVQLRGLVICWQRQVQDLQVESAVHMTVLYVFNHQTQPLWRSICRSVLVAVKVSTRPLPKI